MEILTYVLKGSLAHKDSMGHQEELGPNEIQRMSAGTGVTHSEFNASSKEPVHLLQIWIETATTGTPSSYEQLGFAPEEKQGKWKLLANSKGGNGVARINQDAAVSVAELQKDAAVTYQLGLERYGWLQVINGEVTVNGTALQAGDAAALTKEERLNVVGVGETGNEVLFFDLA
jgi:hypothetical protein